MQYKRKIYFEVEKSLEGNEVLLVIGPRQVGKTVLLHQVEELLRENNKLVWFLNLEDPEYLSLLSESPKNLFKVFPVDLERKNYLLIDEVQYLKNPSNFLKYFFDEYAGKIKILASGSSAFYMDRKFKDSLAGRKKIFTMLTLSFEEFLELKGERKLAERMKGEITLSEKEKVASLYLEYVTYGGYPKVVLARLEEKKEILFDLVYSYVKKDIFEASIGQEEIFYKLLKVLAAQVGNLVNSFELSKSLGVSKTAVDNYLLVMQRSFHIVLIRPFFGNIKRELTKMPKVFFVDLGLRNFLRGNFEVYYRREDKGMLLENAVFRHLLDKNDKDEIKFWRTVDGHEVDFVIGGRGAVEVKSSTRKIKKTSVATFKKNYPKIGLKTASFGSGTYPWQV